MARGGVPSPLGSARLRAALIFSDAVETRRGGGGAGRGGAEPPAPRGRGTARGEPRGSERRQPPGDGARGGHPPRGPLEERGVSAGD